MAKKIINKNQKRLSDFKKYFASKKCDAFFVTCEPNVTYLSGYTGTESYLLITKDKQFFLTDSRYIEQAQNEAKAFECVLRNRSYVEIVRDLCQKLNIKRLGVEELRISLSLYRALSRSLKDTFVVSCPNAIERFRLRKDGSEVKHLKRSVDIACQGVRQLECTLAPGMSEREIQAKLEYDTKVLGSEKPAFDMIVACGPNSSMPHAISGNRKVSESDMVLVDMGVVDGGYHSDLTRCFFIGKIPPLKQKIYDIVRKAQELGIKKAKPGVRTKDVDLACREYIDRKGYGKYFGHGTGHGVGLEIHEGPTVSYASNEILEPGMVVTVEPGIYLPGKFGVRIEDMILIKDRGHEVLTGALSK